MSWQIHHLDPDLNILDTEDYETFEAARRDFELLCTGAVETCEREGWLHVAYELRQVGAEKYTTFFSLHMPIPKAEVKG